MKCNHEWERCNVSRWRKEAKFVQIVSLLLAWWALLDLPLVTGTFAPFSFFLLSVFISFQKLLTVLQNEAVLCHGHTQTYLEAR